MEEEELEVRSVTPTERSDKPSPARSGSQRSGGKKSKLPVTVPKPFKLGLNSRIEQRHKFDEDIRDRNELAEQKEREERERREKEDKEELKKYRKSLVFKANPIHKYKPISLSPSSKELTVPHAPNLSSVRRKRQPSDGSSVDDSPSPQATAKDDGHFEQIL